MTMEILKVCYFINNYGISLEKYGIYFTWGTGDIYNTLIWQICTASHLLWDQNKYSTHCLNNYN